MNDIRPEGSLIDTRVWDLPTRLFHWSLASCVIISVASAQIGGNAMAWHFRSGYAIFTLLAFRLLWGLLGGRWSRFYSFAHGPATLWRYLRGRAVEADRLDVGHSPLGALSVFALLAVLSLQVVTGLLADDEIAHVGPLNGFVSNAAAHRATAWHTDYGKALILGLVGLHLAALAVFAIRGKGLVGAMVSGDKALPAGTPASDDSRRRRLLALVLLLACAAGVSWVVSLGG